MTDNRDKELDNAVSDILPDVQKTTEDSKEESLDESSTKTIFEELNNLKTSIYDLRDSIKGLRIRLILLGAVLVGLMLVLFLL